MKSTLLMHNRASTVIKSRFFTIIIALAVFWGSGQLAADQENKLEFHTQMGHSDNIGCLAFSPNSRYLLSGSLDRTIRLWDVATGKELRTFRTDYTPPDPSGFDPVFDSVVLVAFTDTENRAVSCSMGGTLTSWDTATGNPVKTLATEESGLEPIVFSQDGRFILSHTGYKHVKLRDISSGKEIITITEKAPVAHSIALSPNRKLAALGIFETIKVWDLSSGKLIKTLAGHTDIIDSLVFSPDSTKLLSGATDRMIILWDISTGKKLQTLNGHRDLVSDLAFSPDGKRAVSGSYDLTCKIWDLEKGIELVTLSGHEDAILCVVFSPDGNFIASGSFDKAIRLWDAVTGKTVKILSGLSKEINTIALSQDMEKALCGSGDRTLKLWDMKRGKIKKTLTGHPDSVSTAALSPDAGQALSWSADNTCIRWDLSSGRELMRFFDDSDFLLNTGFPDDLKLVLTGRLLPLALWDGVTGTMKKRFQSHMSAVFSIVFSKDNNIALTGALQSLILWDTKTGKELKRIPGHSGPVTAVALSGDKTVAFSGSTDALCKRWNINTGKEITTFSGHSQTVVSLSLSGDEKLLLSGSADGTLKLWDALSGKEKKTLTGHSDSVTDACLSPDGQFALSGSMDGTMRLWDVKTGKWIAFMANADGSQWLVFTEDGYWDSSPDGGNLVAMVSGIECYNIDQFAVRNNRPDIILSRLPGADKEEISHFLAQYKKRLNKLGFTEKKVKDTLLVPGARIERTEQNGKYVTLTYRLKDESCNLSLYNIYVNDVPLFGGYGRKTKAVKALSGEETIELETGENKIEVSCINEQGTESYRALTQVYYGEKTKGNLYFIGFGVSKYMDPGLNLKYADKDVLDLADMFTGLLTSGQFGTIRSYTFTNKECTVRNIKNAGALVKDATVDDTVVLFISGHGIHDRDRDATYYFITYETDLSNLPGTAANFTIIEDILQGIRPRRKLFLMDTCESGEAEEEQVWMDPAIKGKGIIARMIKTKSILLKSNKKRTYVTEKDRYIYNDLARRSGAIVFSSCRGNELSYEDDTIRNGFFTEWIIKAMGGKEADNNRDDIISVDELRNYVMSGVPHQTGGLQHPTVDRDNIFQKFGFKAAVSGKTK
ncbi:MAG: caspase family protein [Spirochaetales bacterium]|nr:caspase family protein [Spirochaetales bacterium]